MLNKQGKFDVKIFFRYAFTGIAR